MPPRKPRKPNRLDVAAELALAHRKAVEAELEAAVAAKAVPREHGDIYRLRLSLSLVEAAPSWPIWKPSKELQERGLADPAEALRFVVLGLRAGRSVASNKSALEIRGAIDRKEEVQGVGQIPARADF
jgi:hypothetical protein